MGNTPFKMTGHTLPGPNQASPAKQSYPSSSQTGPHGPRGTLDIVKQQAVKKGGKNIIKKGLSRFIPGLGAGLLAWDVLKHGVKNIKKRKTKIPEGHYKKGGAGYQKQDYSKSFDFSGNKDKS